MDEIWLRLPAGLRVHFNYRQIRTLSLQQFGHLLKDKDVSFRETVRTINPSKPLTNLPISKRGERRRRRLHYSEVPKTNVDIQENFAKNRKLVNFNLSKSKYFRVHIPKADDAAKYDVFILCEKDYIAHDLSSTYIGQALNVRIKDGDPI
jgi:hypothetical protein